MSAFYIRYQLAIEIIHEAKESKTNFSLGQVITLNSVGPSGTKTTLQFTFTSHYLVLFYLGNTQAEEITCRIHNIQNFETTPHMASVISLVLTGRLPSVSLRARLDITFWTHTHRHKETPNQKHTGARTPKYCPIYSCSFLLKISCIYSQRKLIRTADLHFLDQMQPSSLPNLFVLLLLLFLINQNLTSPQRHSAKIRLT